MSKSNDLFYAALTEIQDTNFDLFELPLFSDIENYLNKFYLAVCVTYAVNCKKLLLLTHNIQCAVFPS